MRKSTAPNLAACAAFGVACAAASLSSSCSEPDVFANVTLHARETLDLGALERADAFGINWFVEGLRPDGTSVATLAQSTDRLQGIELDGQARKASFHLRPQQVDGGRTTLLALGRSGEVVLPAYSDVKDDDPVLLDAYMLIGAPGVSQPFEEGFPKSATGACANDIGDVFAFGLLNNGYRFDARADLRIDHTVVLRQLGDANGEASCAIDVDTGDLLVYDGANRALARGKRTDAELAVVDPTIGGGGEHPRIASAPGGGIWLVSLDAIVFFSAAGAELTSPREPQLPSDFEIVPIGDDELAIYTSDLAFGARFRFTGAGIVGAGAIRIVAATARGGRTFALVPGEATAFALVEIGSGGTTDAIRDVELPGVTAPKALRVLRDGRIAVAAIEGGSPVVLVEGMAGPVAASSTNIELGVGDALFVLRAQNEDGVDIVVPPLSADEL